METQSCLICGSPEPGWHEPSTAYEGHYFTPNPQPLAIIYIKCPHCREGIILEVGKWVADYTRVEKLCQE